MHTTEPLVRQHSYFEVKTAIEKFKTYKSPGTEQIAADEADDETSRSEIYITV
jgi:hypothetical protein